MLVSTIVFLLVSASATSAIPSLDEAEKQIIANDSALFWAAFEDCKPASLVPLMTENFRMLHDVSGLVANSRDDFIASLERQCQSREPGGDNEGYKNRRLHVPGSRLVTPLGEWGVLERGMHTFHEWRESQQTWQLVGGARYIHVWKWSTDEGKFRLEESISIDHGAATAYPPSN